MSDAEYAGTEEIVDDGTISNAQGALDVVHETSATVDEQLDGIAERTTAQSGDAEQVVAEVSNLSATIEEIAATASDVSERSEQTAQRAADGQVAAREAMDVMQAVRATSEAVVEEVETLRQQIDRIETTLAGIDDIADQTNMLALNASIEAARAGDAGSGFAVVADEVKSLAEDAQRQAGEIDTVLSEVRQATDETIGQLDEAVTEIDRGTDQVEEAMESLKGITEAVEETAEGVQSVSAATDEQAETAESVTRQVEAVAERADAIERDVGEIRGARNEQTAMLAEVDAALDAASAGRASRLVDRARVRTGVEGLDDVSGGGLPVGSQAVLCHDGTDDATVAKLVATHCGAALAAGRAVSLTPPPALDRPLLETVLAAHDQSLDEALRDGRLFVLDAFGTWGDERNVFDLDAGSLSDANRRTDRRRDRPLLVVGNIAGEIAVMGERAAREARYENDGSVLTDDDTVVNVVDESAVDDQFQAFYTGAADQVLATYQEAGDQYVELVTAPVGTEGATRRLVTSDRPPFVTVGER